jgi:chromosome partitioning protein
MGGSTKAQESSNSTHIIAVGNQKGGVGKTTNSVHIAAALGEMGRRCLLIDLDANQGSTRHLGVPSTSFLGTYEVLIGEEQPTDVIITNGEDDVALPKNVDLIAANRKLEGIEDALRQQSKFIVEQDILIGPLRTLQGQYDYIFLDTAPNASAPTVAAYKAARWFILAAMPSPFAVAGLNDALVDIQDAQNNGNPDLEVLGVVLAGVDGRRTRLATALIDYVDETFRFGNDTSAKFNTVISRSVVIDEAQKAGKTLFETHPDHKLTDQYRSVAKEVEERLNSMTTARSIGADGATSSKKAVANG